MKVPVQITFRNMERDRIIEAIVRRKSAGLEKYFPRMMGCRVVIEAPHRRHRSGNLFHVRVDATVPGKELVVRRDPRGHGSARVGSIPPAAPERAGLTDDEMVLDCSSMRAFPREADRSELKRRSLTDLVFEDVPMPIMVTDATPVIIRVNRAFTRVTGYDAAEVLGRNPRILASGRHSRHFYQKMWEAVIARGAWEGEIWDRRKNGEIFPEMLAISAVRDDHGEVTHYIGTFRDITSRKQREAHLQHLSHQDPLTELPNRALFLDRLDQSIRRARRLERQFALLFIDLDAFKAVNDTAGHLVGDHVLKDVATRLASVVRDMDTVARVGGDEFAILLSEIGTREQVAVFADRILDVLSRPVQLSGRTYACRCSIGISLGPRRDDDPEHVLERADSAMYLAKRRGGGRYTFVD